MGRVGWFRMPNNADGFQVDFHAADVIRDDGQDTGERIILRGFTANRFPIYDVRQPDGTYVRQCHDPEWIGV